MNCVFLFFLVLANTNSYYRLFYILQWLRWPTRIKYSTIWWRRRVSAHMICLEKERYPILIPKPTMSSLCILHSGFGGFGGNKDNNNNQSGNTGSTFGSGGSTFGSGGSTFGSGNTGSAFGSGNNNNNMQQGGTSQKQSFTNSFLGGFCGALLGNMILPLLHIK